MAKKKRRYRTYIDRDFGTVALMNAKTGKLMGRKAVKGKGDSTAVIRATSPKESKGWILGRTEPINVRGSSSSRGYTKNIIRRRI